METPQVPHEEDPFVPLNKSAGDCIDNGQYAEAIDYLECILRTPFEKKDSSEDFVVNISQTIHLFQHLADKINYPKLEEIREAIKTIDQKFLDIRNNSELSEEQANQAREDACIEASNLLLPYVSPIKECINKNQPSGVNVPAVAIAGIGLAAVAAGVVIFLRRRKN